MTTHLDYKFNDRLTVKDDVKLKSGVKSMRHKSRVVPSGKQLRTDIQITNELGETVFRTDNITVLGGAVHTLIKLFNINFPIEVEYLNDIMGIANDGPDPVSTTPLPAENAVCLFGVGIGGAGDSFSDVKPDRFVEREIPEMIPFRVTEEALDSADQEKYWFRKLDTNTGKTSYYLKKFETTPTGKAFWRDNVNSDGEYEDGTEVEPNPHLSQRTDGMDILVEFILKVTSKDIREFFVDAGEIDSTRINSIGVFSGVLGTLADGSTDYKQVQLFSKFNIPNDVLFKSKELNMAYRIYTA